MKKNRKRGRGARHRKQNAKTLGSALDEMGLHARQRILVSRGTISPALKARLKFEKATADMAAEHLFGGPDHHSTELEILEEASRLVKEVKRDRKPTGSDDT